MGRACGCGYSRQHLKAATMKASDEAMMKLCESLASEIGAGDAFEQELGEFVGRWRRKLHIEIAMRETGYNVRRAAGLCRITCQAVYKRHKVNQKRSKSCMQPA